VVLSVVLFFVPLFVLAMVIPPGGFLRWAAGMVFPLFLTGSGPIFGSQGCGILLYDGRQALFFRNSRRIRLGGKKTTDAQDGNNRHEEDFRAPFDFLPVRPAFHNQYRCLLGFYICSFRMNDHVQDLPWISLLDGLILGNFHERNMKGPAQNCELCLRQQRGLRFCFPETCRSPGLMSGKFAGTTQYSQHRQAAGPFLQAPGCKELPAPACRPYYYISCGFCRLLGIHMHFSLWAVVLLPCC